MLKINSLATTWSRPTVFHLALGREAGVMTATVGRNEVILSETGAAKQLVRYYFSILPNSFSPGRKKHLLQRDKYFCEDTQICYFYWISLNMCRE